MPGPASDSTIDVNTEALEEFMQVFEQLLALQKSGQGSVHSTTGKALGTFDAATETAAKHDAMRREHLVRLKRLLAALQASEKSTAQTIVNYDDSDAVAKSNMNAFFAALAETGSVGDAPGMIEGSGPKEA